MKCTFYRPETINTEEWNAICSKLRTDLDELETGRVPETEVIEYLEDLLPAAGDKAGRHHRYKQKAITGRGNWAEEGGSIEQH